MANGAPQQGKPPGLLDSLTKKIAAAGALVAAVAGLVLNMDKLIDRFFPKPENGSVVVDGPRQASDCIEIVPTHLPVIPYALKHNFQSSDHLYWLKLRVENRCEEDFWLKVICEPVEAEKAVRCGSYPRLRIKPGPATDHQIDPNLDIDGVAEGPVNLRLEILVEDEQGSRVDDYSLPVTVLPHTTYFWDLKDTAKEHVLASLAVWTIRPRDPVAALSDELERSWESIDDWAARAYEAVFGQLEFVHDQRQVPPKTGRDRLKINTPEAVLAGGRANPVEAALLFGALGYRVINDHAARIVLVSAPAADRSRPNRVFVAWESGDRLKAFEVPSLPGEFTAATERAASDLGSHLATIRASLNLPQSKGVFIDADDKRLVALDLGMTTRRYKLLTGLP